MKSKYISRIIIVPLLSFSNVQSQVKWQQFENNPNAYFTPKCLVNVGQNTFVSYMSYDPNSVDLHFYILDSVGTKVKDTIFSYPSRTEEYVMGVYKLSDSRVVITSGFSDSNFVLFNMLTCYDSIGNFLYRIQSDTIGILGNISTSTISNDTIMLFYQNGNYYIDLYNMNGGLLSHTQVANYFTGVGNSIFQADGFVYKNGIIYTYGYIYLGGQDAEFAIYGTSLLGNSVFTGISNVTNRDDRVKNVAVDDSSNVYYIGTSDLPNYRKFHVGRFSSLGTIQWQDSVLIGGVGTSPIDLFIKDNYLYTCSSSAIQTRFQGDVSRYDLNSGIKVNVALLDSVSSEYALNMKSIGSKSILIGGLRGISPNISSLFLELDVNTILVDTLHIGQTSIYNFPYMIPRDTIGFYYGRADIVHYFEKTITSISENELDNDFQLPYPNPFYDKLNLECKETDIINFYDYSGRLCLSSLKSELEKKLPQLAKGNYIVEIINGGVSKKFRLVKN